MPPAGIFARIANSAGCPLRVALVLIALAPATALAEPEFHGRLTGIVIAASLREAIFIEDSGTRRIHPGETIEGWTVDSVEPDAVTLTAEDVTTRLSPSRSLAPGNPLQVQAPAPISRTHQVGDALLRQQRGQTAAETATAEMAAQKAARHRANAPE